MIQESEQMVYALKLSIGWFDNDYAYSNLRHNGSPELLKSRFQSYCRADALINNINVR